VKRLINKDAECTAKVVKKPEKSEKYLSLVSAVSFVVKLF